MLKSIYGMKEVFDVGFFDNNNGQMLFDIDTSCEFEIKRKHGRTSLIIHDALINLDVTNRFLNGDYDILDFKIIGNSEIRNVETGEDVKVALTIHHAQFHSYGFGVSVSDLAKPRLQFDVLDANGELFQLMATK